MREAKRVDDAGKKGKGKEVANGGESGKLRVPEEVVTEGLRVVRRELEDVVDVEEG